MCLLHFTKVIALSELRWMRTNMAVVATAMTL
jgi:hypothetical protein